MNQLAFWACIGFCLSSVGGCAGARSGGFETIDVPALSEAAFATESRRYLSLKKTDPGRPALRRQLLATLLVDAEGLVRSGDYDAVVAQLARITDLYTPDEIATTAFPRALQDVAGFVAERGAPRGDEGRVLAALFLLDRMEPGASHRREYETVAAWGRNARSNLIMHNRPEAYNVFERYNRLLDVWTHHAILTPAPEVLDRLSQLYIARRDSLVASADELAGSYTVGPNRVWQATPSDIAAVYLAEGEVAAAVTKVESLGPGGDAQDRLLTAMRRVGQDDDTAAEALADLIGQYRGRPDVAYGLCTLGVKRFSQDYRFSACLARIAAGQRREMDATAWYLDSIERAPGRQELYDEALVQLDRFIRERLGASYPQRSAELARGAEKILAARQQRWPSSKPPFATDRLHYLVGMLEMHAGDADEATRRFEASLAANENPAALVELGSLLERTGKTQAADTRYRRALALLSEQSLGDEVQRATILEHLGDTAQFQRRTAEADKRYKGALAIWDEQLDGTEAKAYAWVQLRRGVLLDRLGDKHGAARAFVEAVGAAPQWQEVYATILSHLVTGGPNLELAESISQRSLLQIDLPPEWRVYFSLWLQTIAARAGEPVPKDVSSLLARLGKGGAWWGHLAQFGSAKIDHAELIARASTPGERAEAYYYGGARELASGNSTAAAEQFRRVLDTKMVSFYEYEMARRLLFEMGSSKTGGTR